LSAPNSRWSVFVSTTPLSDFAEADTDVTVSLGLPHCRSKTTMTGMRHYGLFKLPKYRTNSEGMRFAATLLTELGLIVKACFS
jgi:hypothetical protein